MVKPQFEVGRERVGKGGVVHDQSAHIDALQSVIESASLLQWHPKGVIPSPLTGPAGNHEYLLWLGANRVSSDFNLEQIVAKALS